ncbi:MAG: sugar phosphate isomerase/epimerase [Victivallales bacterium]|nr:sugar phosphate isomerase/epimerase [Victivallales bacterium]
MKKNQIAAQLYSFRNFIKTTAGMIETLSALKKMGYDAVQLSAAIAPMPESELRAILDGEGLIAPTAHESAAKIISETEAAIDHLLKLDCFHVAYPYPHIIPGSGTEAAAFAAKLNETAVKMARHGIKLAYHNHAVEFIRFGNRTMLDIIYAEAPALDSELDTFWVQAGGGNPVEWIRRMPGRMEVIHIKDFGVDSGQNRLMMPVGSGNLNWDRIIAAAEKAGTKWYVVEHDANCADPFESFRSSMNYLNENFIN